MHFIWCEYDINQEGCDLKKPIQQCHKGVETAHRSHSGTRLRQLMVTRLSPPLPPNSTLENIYGILVHQYTGLQNICKHSNASSLTIYATFDQTNQVLRYLYLCKMIYLHVDSLVISQRL